MNSDNGFENSKIEIGNWNPENILEGHELEMLETLNSTTWALLGKNFIVGNESSEGTPSFLPELRFIYLEPSSPFIYAPAADFVKFAREL
jgi:hypothetical protein